MPHYIIAGAPGTGKSVYVRKRLSETPGCTLLFTADTTSDKRENLRVDFNHPAGFLSGLESIWRMRAAADVARLLTALIFPGASVDSPGLAHYRHLSQECLRASVLVLRECNIPLSADNLSDLLEHAEAGIPHLPQLSKRTRETFEEAARREPGGLLPRMVLLSKQSAKAVAALEFSGATPAAIAWEDVLRPSASTTFVTPSPLGGNPYHWTSTLLLRLAQVGRERARLGWPASAEKTRVILDEYHHETDGFAAQQLLNAADEGGFQVFLVVQEYSNGIPDTIDGFEVVHVNHPIAKARGLVEADSPFVETN